MVKPSMPARAVALGSSATTLPQPAVAPVMPVSERVVTFTAGLLVDQSAVV